MLENRSAKRRRRQNWCRELPEQPTTRIEFVRDSARGLAAERLAKRRNSEQKRFPEKGPSLLHRREGWERLPQWRFRRRWPCPQQSDKKNFRGRSIVSPLRNRGPRQRPGATTVKRGCSPWEVDC